EVDRDAEQRDRVRDLTAQQPTRAEPERGLGAVELAVAGSLGKRPATLEDGLGLLQPAELNEAPALAVEDAKREVRRAGRRLGVEVGERLQGVGVAVRVGERLRLRELGRGPAADE